MASITASTRDLSDYANRRGPIDAKVKAARASGNRRRPPRSTGTGKDAYPASKLQCSSPWRTPASSCRKSPLSCHITMLIAHRPDRRSGSLERSGKRISAVQGAWYAAPDTSSRSNLERDYAAKFGTPPPPLADLAFDSAAIARTILDPGE